MRKFLDELEPGLWRLREPIWKFDSLVLDAGTLLSGRELAKLKGWGLTRIDVVPVHEETRAEEPLVDLVLPALPPEPFLYAEGVTDVVPPRALATLASTDLARIDTIEDLERVEFDLEEALCKPNLTLYLPGAVTIPAGYGAREVARSLADLQAFLRVVFDRTAEGLDFDFTMLKLLATLKVEEQKLLPGELLRAVPGSGTGDHLCRHSAGVAILAVAVGERFGYPEARRAELCVAALLHDLGMARIPRDTWDTAKRFRFDDYFPVFKHPILGVDHLARVLGNRLGGLVTLAVYGHHERIDGSGYPKGRRGTGVSEYARILAACDAFEAMTNGRPHRKALPPAEAFRFLAENTGTLFDRRVVDALHAALAAAGVLPDGAWEAGETGARPVLIADPSPYNLWYICQLLRTNRIPVHAARTEEDLARAAATLSPRVVVIDAAINARKGLDLIGALRGRDETRATPLIYTSTSGDKGDVMHAIRLGVRDYLKKPYTFDFAVNRLSKFLQDAPGV